MTNDYKNGDVVQACVIKTMRWKKYKPPSQQLKKGIEGRWQVHNGYGWENADFEPAYFLPPDDYGNGIPPELQERLSNK